MNVMNIMFSTLILLPDKINMSFKLYKRVSHFAISRWSFSWDYIVGYFMAKVSGI